jgi:RsiW-degrading membrane proteinase PrsW (M82 family)
MVKNVMAIAAIFLSLLIFPVSANAGAGFRIKENSFYLFKHIITRQIKFLTQMAILKKGVVLSGKKRLTLILNMA